MKFDSKKDKVRVKFVKRILSKDLIIIVVSLFLILEKSGLIEMNGEMVSS